MSTLVAAARVFARAAAIQVEEAARVAGPVAVSKAMHARDVRQRETNEAEVQAQLDAVHDAEAVHYPAPWPTAGPSTAATSPSASASVSAQAAPAPTPVERPPLPPHTPPPPPVSPELKPPAVKIAKVVKVVPQPLEIPAVEKVEPKIEVKVETKSAEHLRAEEQQALFAKAEQARLRDAARTEEQAELFARAEKANILAEAEDAASKLPPIDTDPDEAPVALRASTVPSTRLGRLFHYGCECLQSRCCTVIIYLPSLYISFPQADEKQVAHRSNNLHPLSISSLASLVVLSSKLIPSSCGLPRYRGRNGNYPPHGWWRRRGQRVHVRLKRSPSCRYAGTDARSGTQARPVHVDPG